MTEVKTVATPMDLGVKLQKEDGFSKEIDPVGCKWVFRINYRSNGDIEQYKAHLVAKEFAQKHGIDYGETNIFTSFKICINQNNACIYGTE